jgi:hypothetical protein
MTTQEAYERIRAHFLADGRFGFDTVSEFCLYRTDEGAKCAVGCLIPDGNPMLQSGHAIYGLTRDYPEEFNALFEGVEYGFLADAQSAHDAEAKNGDQATIASFIETLDLLAADYRLQVVGD